MVRISIESIDKEDPYYQKCSVESNAEDIYEMGQQIRQVLLGWSFHPETVDELFNKE